MVAKDLTGQKFGRITFLNRSAKKQGTSYFWDGICDCGNPVCIVPSKVVRGITTSCGCYVKEVAKKRLKDWTGQKFGRITFLRRSTTTHHAYQWEGICDCGTSVLLVPSDAKRGQTVSCGCYQKELLSKRSLDRRQYSPRISSARKVWQISYKDGNITFPEFLELSQKNCHYCGIAPYRIRNPHSTKASAFMRDNGDFIYNGLDRVDSSKPHDLDNVVPCCKLCNQAKMNLSVREFAELISRIYHHSAAKLLNLDSLVSSEEQAA